MCKIRHYTLALLFCFSALGADWYVTNGRVIAQFDSIPANRVNQINAAVAGSHQQGDLLATSISLRWFTNDGVISGAMMLDFITSNSAAATWATLTNYSFPPNTYGSLSFHMCSIDSANTNAYFPCNSTNAYYLEKRFE